MTRSSLEAIRRSRHGDVHAMMLFAASTVTRRREMHTLVAERAQSMDWAAASESLSRRGLLSLLGPTLLELADRRFGEEVERALQAGRRRNAFLSLISAELTTALAQAGIRASPLKGTQLGHAVYGDLGRRPSSDIDLLLDPKDLSAACAVMRARGYESPEDHVLHGLPLLHFALVHSKQELPPVELHWRIHWYERRFATERLLVPEPDPVQAWRPEPAAQLVALLLFYARDGFVDLRLASDIAAWWDTFGQDVTADALEELVRTYPALSRPIRAAMQAAHQIVGIPAAGRSLSLGRRELRTRLAVRMANPNPRASVPQLHAEIGIVDGLLAPPGGLREYVARQLLPPVEVLKQRAHETGDARGSSRPGHLTRILVRYALSLKRLVRRRETLAHVGCR